MKLWGLEDAWELVDRRDASRVDSGCGGTKRSSRRGMERKEVVGGGLGRGAWARERLEGRVVDLGGGVGGRPRGEGVVGRRREREGADADADSEGRVGRGADVLRDWGANKDRHQLSPPIPSISLPVTHLCRVMEPSSERCEPFRRGTALNARGPDDRRARIHRRGSREGPSRSRRRRPRVHSPAFFLHSRSLAPAQRIRYPLPLTSSKA